jgi:hypothetical protein
MSGSLVVYMEGIKQFREQVTDAVLAKSVAQVEEALKNAEEIVITDALSLNSANESFLLSHKLLKLFTEDRQEKTAPHKKKAKDIEATYSLIIDPLEAIKKNCNDKILAFRRQEEDRARREREEAEKERAAQLAAQREEELAAAKTKGVDAPPPLELPEPPPPAPSLPQATHTAVGTAYTNKPWIAKVTDMQALCKAIGEGKAPLTFVEIRQSVINARAKEQKGPSPYPGIVFEQEEKLRPR